MMNKPVLIKKNSGEHEAFDVNKLINSLRRSQADKGVIQEIANSIQAQIVEGMTTQKIYQLAFKMLKAKSRRGASKYKLKKALMELGPTGFPFEKMVGKLFEHEGYVTNVGVIVEGKCVKHEVDVIAQKGNYHYMIECKYHSDQGRFCNVKIPLYIYARFLDVESKWEQKKGHKTKLHQGGLYTNTRFSSDAIQYGKCVGLLLTSWDYPVGNSLKDRIDKLGLHPLTALTVITKAEKTMLLDKGVVLCKELHEQPELLNQIGIDKKRQKIILEDSEALCKST